MNAALEVVRCDMSGVLDEKGERLAAFRARLDVVVYQRFVHRYAKLSDGTRRQMLIDLLSIINLTENECKASVKFLKMNSS